MSEKTAQLARQRLDTPRSSRFRFNFDVEAVGRVSESIARFLGTGRYLLIQTIIVIIWILLNLFAIRLRWDPYPFILLNLAFSTQAAYAAPLILLAQNRQENRDRVSLEEDRARSAQTKADTEFLARELAAVRLAVGEVATRDYLRRELEDLKEELLEARTLADAAASRAVDTAASRAVDTLAASRAADTASSRAADTLAARKTKVAPNRGKRRKKQPKSTVEDIEKQSDTPKDPFEGSPDRSVTGM